MHRPFRLVDIMVLMRKYRLEPKRMKLVYPFADKEPNMVLIEANTMIDMARREIAPAVSGYAAELAHTAAAKKAVDSSLSCGYETELLKKLAMLEDQIMIRSEELQEAVLEIRNIGDIAEESRRIRDTVLGKMGQLRVACDSAETMTAKKYWPFPTYEDLLFSVR